MSEIRKIEVVLDAFGRMLSLGTLTGETVKGRERVSFVYEPDLPLRHIFFGPDLSPAPQAMERETLFGFLSDTAPDRWGRTLIQRKAALSALERRESVRRLHELDYLLAVDDLTRTGALRFRTQDGPFLSEHSFVPPLFELRRLERAVRDYTSGKLVPGLLALLAPGSSLGGVRPKACMTAPDGAFWLAKFPHRHDDWDVSAWEWTVHRLAADCGLNVGATRFERMERGRGVFLVERFDRNGDQRIPYISAMSLLGRRDGESGTAGYYDIAQFIERYGHKDDLAELFQRIAFSIAISNSDDHLRNHGFLMDESGRWRLSPAFDLNPSPFDIGFLSLNVAPDDPSASFENLLETVPFYELTESQGLEIVRSVKETVASKWRRYAEQAEIGKDEQRMMAHCFAAAERDLRTDDIRPNEYGIREGGYPGPAL